MALLRRSPTRLSWIFTVLIVGAWAVLMGSMVKDRYLPSPSQITETLSIASTESDNWFLIRIRGAYAGFGRSRQFRKGERWLLRDDLHISLNLQGTLKPIRIVNKATVDQDFRLISFTLKVSTGIVSFEQRGHMDGRELVLTLPKYQGGGTKRIKLFERPRISRSLGLPVPLTDLSVGDEITIPVFDPMDGHKWDAFVKVLEKSTLPVAGKDETAWLVRGYFRSMELTMWVDDEGRLLKGRLPLGITVMRSDRDEITTAMQGIGDLPDMMALSAVPVEGSIKNPRQLKTLQLRLLKGGNLKIATDQFRQRKDGNTLHMTQERVPSPTYELPWQGTRVQQFLASSRFVRSDHEAIIAQAREIVGSEKDPVKAARLINSWVYENLEKVPTPSVPDAYTVLQTKRGDCNEHAILAVSLARSIGLPAKMALGLVYLEDGFYYHAWVAYWAGDTWLTGDPLMGQMPTDPTHVALMYGDVDKHTNVITYLGKLKFEVLEASTRRLTADQSNKPRVN